MPCRPIEVDGEVVGIVCGRGRPRRLCKCGRNSTKLCDYPLRGRRAGQTCDRPLCEKCATKVGTHVDGAHKGDTLDYCRAHAAMTVTHG